MAFRRPSRARYWLGLPFPSGSQSRIWPACRGTGHLHRCTAAEFPGEHGVSVPGVIVFAPAAPITFTNAQYVVNKLKDLVAGAPETVKLVVIECSGVLDVDYTGALIWSNAIAELRTAHVDVAIARLADERAQRSALQTGLVCSCRCR